MIRSLFAGLFSSVVLFSSSAALATGPTYKLVCRGGGPAKAIEIEQVAGSFYSERFSFSHGAQALGTNLSSLYTLAPGACSWLDRGMRATEGTSFSWSVQPEILEYTSTGTGSFVFESDDGVGFSTGWETGLQSSSCYWYFMVDSTFTAVSNGAVSCNLPAPPL